MSHWEDAWVGMEPTFQSAKSVRMWAECENEDAYFHDRYILGTQRAIARDIVKKFRRKKDKAWAIFEDVEIEEEPDPWGNPRQDLTFHRGSEEFKIRLTTDPETWEFTIKPVPLRWFYDENFVRFLDEFVWEPPMKRGLTPTVRHGGCQFSVSVKNYLIGSLLADDIATKCNHPELSTWILDWPNCDDRSFRATRPRLDAFRRTIDAYWEGRFRPRTAGDAILDRGWEPGPRGPVRHDFATNFAFGRAIRLYAQNVDPGYWQAASPKEDGYRPDQIMRYGEGNLNRMQIAGELHVKSGKVLEPERVPRFEAPLDASMLADEASWENRGQMGRTSARDFVEALLLDIEHAKWLEKHPRVKVKASLLQDRLFDGTALPAKTLSRLKREAEKYNLEISHGRIKSDWIEPETTFLESWKAMKASEKEAIAEEAVSGFVERVEQAGRPMKGHWHRIDPELRKALRRPLPEGVLERPPLIP